MRRGSTDRPTLFVLAAAVAITLFVAGAVRLAELLGF